jgi:nicotinamide mononucleotide transporter
VNAIFENIRQGFAGATALDQANLVLGVAGVGLMARRSLWAFPVGLAAVSVQGVLFFRTRFYADAALQVFFFAALAWGWRHWVKARGAEPELPVTVLTWRARAWVTAAALAGMTAWVLVVGRWIQSQMPWRDAFIAAFSVAAQVLQARKQLENWALWTVVNGVAIGSYWSAELAYTAFLYAIYLALGIAGWIGWRRAREAQAHA